MIIDAIDPSLLIVSLQVTVVSVTRVKISKGQIFAIKVLSLV